VILLTGKNGQVGSELLTRLPNLGEVVAPGREQLDLCSPESIRQVIRDVRPQLIVNAAAYTAVDQAEREIATARAVNEYAPSLLATEAKRVGAALVHYSTDYVFDGKKRIPYTEADPANPLSIYGRTKDAGEESIRSSGAEHLILRTSWVYATRGRNFLLTILRLATERQELRIVDDQIGAPTCAADLAAATCKLLTGIAKQNDGRFVFSAVSGTYHLTAGGQTSWCDFAHAILRAAQAGAEAPTWLADVTKGRPFMVQRLIPVSTEEFRAPARRPAFSVLSNSRLLHTFGLALADWRAQLKQCFALDNNAAGR
jgi:dTDP-4-dehydrorhamnose reductase